ncbi:MAG: carboxyvinyl-carboxyphosphonate phosphorylmutase [Alphaproteobacteria bacterium]|nr:carboxyvinyl-carboxyphosphonate phosphorylmutase [Alphaproteobacteria bacterium]
MSAGARLRAELTKGVVIAPGAYDALSARIAAKAGAKCIYMSGFGIAGSLLGVPDIGLVTANEMIERVRALSAVCAPVPLIADGDNGYGGPLNVERLVRAYEQAGAAAIQIEDQVIPKRCGHMDGKEIVPRDEAAMKVKAAAGARADKDFVVIARTDAISVSGLDEALHRADAFLKAGADILFVEAPRSEADLRAIADRFKGVPLLANMVEGGKTPVLGTKALAEMGYRLILYPISALLAVARLLERAYANVGHDGLDRVSFADYCNTVGLADYLAKAAKLSE